MNTARHQLEEASVAIALAARIIATNSDTIAQHTDQPLFKAALAFLEAHDRKMAEAAQPIRLAS